MEIGRDDVGHTVPRMLLARPSVRGKFLFEGDRKLYVRGTTYGAFAPNRAGEQFPEAIDATRDLSLMRAAGINTILTYTVPPLWLLDLAQEYGIRVLVTVPWMEYALLSGKQQEPP